MLKLDQSFASRYRVEVLQELPPGRDSNRHYYPGADSEGGRDGLLVQVIPEAAAARLWLGVFAFGALSPKGLTGLLACPNPLQLCVVSRGAGYIVSAKEPGQWESIKAEPVLGAYPVPGNDLIIFADFIRLAAYGPEGLAWRTRRLSWDGIKVSNITQDEIRGTAWDPPSGLELPFAVDLRTGHHEGGSGPQGD